MQTTALETASDRRWISTGFRFAVGAVFVYSGLTKVVDIDGTIRAVRAYDLLPEWIVPTAGTALPVLELALAALLLSGLLTRLAAAIVVALSAAFFIGIASAWARGLSIQCGCFGNGGLTPHPVPGYVRELVLNGLMIIACVWMLRHPVSRWSLDSALGLHVDDGLDELADRDQDPPDDGSDPN
jgi:uncharacterized membrane protein YphA (DoxX/SURF4 family)